MKKLFLALIAICILFGSCEKEDDIVTKEEKKPIEVIQPIEKPTSLEVCDITKNSAEIKWTKVSGATKYSVEYATSNEFNDKIEAEVTSETTSLSKLTAETKYFVRVKAVNIDTFSVYSEAINFETPEDIDRVIKFTNTELEKLVRTALGKSSGDLIFRELLNIDTLKSATSLNSLDEVEILDSLKYLDIKQDPDITEDDVIDLKKILPNCSIIHNKWIETGGKYYELDTLYVESEYYSGNSTYRHELKMEGNGKVACELHVYSDYTTITEAMKNTNDFTNNTNMTNGTFHDRFSSFFIPNVNSPSDLLDYSLSLTYNEITFGYSTTHYLSINAMSFTNSPRIYYYTSKDFE